VNNDMLELYIYYVNEREVVQRRREAGQLAPWTMDPILRNHHFCHNRREDDRGTKEIRALIKTVDEIDRLPCMYTMARLFNHAPTVQTWLEEGLKGVMLDRDAGFKIFNTAYVVSTCGESIDKVEYVARVVYEVAKIDVPRTSCRAAFDALRTVPGLGSFLAGQVVADLKNDRYLADAEDWYTFAVMGPGSKKGLDFIFGPGTTERNFKERLDLLAVVTNGKIPKLHQQDLQNTLCEFSKFVRYKENLPGRRRSYNANN
jgi:alpha-glutamyl/putrescinyl thymine pyrophosphorylase clade 1